MYGKTLTQEEITTNGGDPSKVAVVKAGPAPSTRLMFSARWPSRSVIWLAKPKAWSVPASKVAESAPTRGSS